MGSGVVLSSALGVGPAGGKRGGSRAGGCIPARLLLLPEQDRLQAPSFRGTLTSRALCPPPPRRGPRSRGVLRGLLRLTDALQVFGGRVSTCM